MSAIARVAATDDTIVSALARVAARERTKTRVLALSVAGEDTKTLYWALSGERKVVYRLPIVSYGARLDV